MKVIITRPFEDGEALAVKLRELGHEPVLLPLISIVARKNISVPVKAYQVICLTSANGIRSLASTKALENIPVVAVGDHSLKAAFDAGLLHAIAEGGDVDGLCSFVKKTYAPNAGPVLYLSGSETSGDLEGKLKSYGFEVERIVTYDAVPAKLSGHEVDILNADCVLLYSPRSAKIWLTEIQQLGLESRVSKMSHICLSSNVAAALPQSWTKSIAQNPTEQNVIAMLDRNGKAE